MLRIILGMIIGAAGGAGITYQLMVDHSVPERGVLSRDMQTTPSAMRSPQNNGLGGEDSPRLQGADQTIPAESVVTQSAGLAVSDPDRALDWLVSTSSAGFLDGPQMSNAMGVIMTLGRSQSVDRATVATRLLCEPVQGPMYLSMLISGWAQNDPRGALDWMAGNTAALEPSVYERMAQTIGQIQPQLAANFTARVPESARPLWIASVAQSYAQQDPEEAYRWVSQYRGNPAFDAGMAAIAQAQARYDPARAAELLGTVSSDAQQTQMTATVVASIWAQTDLQAARDWAIALPSGLLRDGAIGIAQPAGPAVRIGGSNVVTNGSVR